MLLLRPSYCIYIIYKLASHRYHQVGSKGRDSNLPAIVTIRVGSKGHDSNLPAIVTIKVGSKGHDLNLPTIVTISTGSRDMIDTACREERSGWKGTEENVIKPTPQVVDSLLFCYFDIIYICIYQCCMGQ